MPAARQCRVSTQQADWAYVTPVRGLAVAGSSLDLEGGDRSPRRGDEAAVWIRLMSATGRRKNVNLNGWLAEVFLLGKKSRRVVSMAGATALQTNWKTSAVTWPTQTGQAQNTAQKATGTVSGRAGHE